LSERERHGRSDGGAGSEPPAEASAPAGPLQYLVDRFGPAAAQKILQRKLEQRRAARRSEESAAQVHTAADIGTSGASGPLPHRDAIQQSFGKHDVSHIKAHTDERAAEGAEAMNAEAFASGSHVAFAGSPSLHTAAHEAAHVLQQRRGVQLKSGVGEAGDAHEQQADEVAQRVVRGESAEPILDQMGGSAAEGAGPETGPVQRLIKIDGSTIDSKRAGDFSAKFATYLTDNKSYLSGPNTNALIAQLSSQEDGADQTWQAFVNAWAAEPVAGAQAPDWLPDFAIAAAPKAGDFTVSNKLKRSEVEEIIAKKTGITGSNLSKLASEVMGKGKASASWHESDQAVLHSSAGSRKAREPMSVFWIRKGDVVTLIAVGSHVGDGSAKYKIDWACKGAQCAKGDSVDLEQDGVQKAPKKS
jgi:hypothetical protein